MNRFLVIFILVTSIVGRGRAERIPFVDLYTSHGRPQKFVLAGRALSVDAGQLTEVGGRGTLASVWHNLRRFAPSEYEDSRVRLSAGGHIVEAVTDREGLFRIEVDARAKPLRAGFVAVTAHVLDARGQPLGTPSTGTVQVVSPRARFAVVSDIDDTILVSEVLQRRRLLWNTFARGVESMRPVTGMAELYAGLAEAPVRAPIFYVSGSPIGLHRKLVAFLERNAFPRGSLVLKHLGARSLLPAKIRQARVFNWMDEADALVDSYDYKIDKINRLMDDLPELQFILVGDSGERDPEVYRRIAEDPVRGKRVAGIFIRKANAQLANDPRFAGQSYFEEPSTIRDALSRIVAPKKFDAAAKAIAKPRRPTAR